MKFIHLFLLAIFLIFSSSVRASEHTEHQHAAANHSKLTLNNGNKWNTDETLRDAMKNIHASVANALSAIHTGRLSPAQYHALGEDIAGQLSLIVKNCKLDPEADQQLHLIIGGIAEGIELATSKKEKK